MNIVQRAIDAEAVDVLVAHGLPPVMARILAARGINHPAQLEPSLAGLLPPQRLTNSETMAALLANAIAHRKRLLVIGDYDADGATASAVAVRGLRMMGAEVGYLVPNRFEYGYGLTPEIVALAAQRNPDILLTVDNGIASVAGVEAANALGLAVLVTDHHLPGDTTPPAACIVNPNQHGCDFPSKHLAGVGVMFYVLLALRAELRRRGVFASGGEPNLTQLLDLVALGTVADLVRLDDNNRILVEQGLRRIRSGHCCPAIHALLRLAGCDPARGGARDLGFSVGPRLNAAGRLDDMSLGIACLLADDEAEALRLAQQLHELNLARRSIEADMQEVAEIALDAIDCGERYSLSLYHAEWHQGVIGILASRIKERHHRPVIAFAHAGADADGRAQLKGSGRSINGLHLRDALDLLSKRHPDLILKFGGHAMAAGLSIYEADFARFDAEFEAVVASLLTPTDLEAVIETDGDLDNGDISWDTAVALERQVWGQGFPQPAFCGDFAVADQRIVGERHLKLLLSAHGRRLDAIHFGGAAEPAQGRVRLAFRLEPDRYRGGDAVQLVVIHREAMPA